jgi:D-alanyl-lipoteichoic acid acyltransferase DltB (MBOAT superfamily)
VRERTHSEGTRMTDLLMIAITLVFFLLAWLYVRACERV